MKEKQVVFNSYVLASFLSSMATQASVAAVFFGALAYLGASRDAFRGGVLDGVPHVSIGIGAYFIAALFGVLYMSSKWSEHRVEVRDDACLDRDELETKIASSRKIALLGNPLTWPLGLSIWALRGPIRGGLLGALYGYLLVPVTGMPIASIFTGIVVGAVIGRWRKERTHSMASAGSVSAA